MGAMIKFSPSFARKRASFPSYHGFERGEAVRENVDEERGLFEPDFLSPDARSRATMLVADDVAFFSREISFLFFFSFLRFLLHAKFGPLCMKVLPPKLGLLLRDRETTDGKPARSRRVSFLEQREKKGEYRDVENWKCRNGTGKNERKRERGGGKMELSCRGSL